MIIYFQIIPNLLSDYIKHFLTWFDCWWQHDWVSSGVRWPLGPRGWWPRGTLPPAEIHRRRRLLPSAPCSCRSRPTHNSNRILILYKVRFKIKTGLRWNYIAVLLYRDETGNIWKKRKITWRGSEVTERGVGVGFTDAWSNTTWSNVPDGLSPFGLNPLGPFFIWSNCHLV